MALGAGRQWRVMAAAAAAATLVAACSAQAEPEPAPSLSGTAEPSSAEPSETATSERPEVEKPERPEAMRRDDVAGAEAAAQYFLELYPYVYATGDLAEWEAMSHPECIFCRSVGEQVSDLHAGDGYQVGGRLDIVRVESRSPGDASEFYAVWIDASELRAERKDTTGNTLEIFEGGPVEFDFALSWDSGWFVRGVEARSVVSEGGTK
ncbi:DUF6318 family protein [Georgenia sp. AZ-5]|uniref:DUF6318 family protein n=1 Tax=Georgenia sp. AZ-5 TaxID=3367526 RepID=UPI0037540E64